MQKHIRFFSIYCKNRQIFCLCQETVADKLVIGSGIFVVVLPEVSIMLSSDQEWQCQNFHIFQTVRFAF
jgi:hypothetical protein